MWPFKKKETRDAEIIVNTDECTVEQDACTQQGIGLINKLLNVNGYGALAQSPFFAAINLISNAVASMSWKTKAYEENVEVPKDFYASRLFDDTVLSQFMTVKNMIKDVLINGNGFAYIHRDKQGNPTSLEYLTPKEVSIIYKPHRSLLYNVTTLTSRLVEPINIIHISLHNENGVDGKSLINYASNTVKLAGASEKAAKTFFDSGMQVKGILSTDTARLTKDQRNAIRQAWQESQLGTGTGLAVLENGMRYQSISSNSKDAELLETRLYNVQEVARWFNISPTLLGDLSKNGYSTLEQAQLQFLVNTLTPYVIMLEQELNRKLINYRDRNKYYIDINEADIVKQDKQSQVNYLGSLVDKGIITRNEARKELGFQPIEGGDELIVAFTDISQNIIGDKNNTEEENV